MVMLRTRLCNKRELDIAEGEAFYKASDTLERN